MTDYASLLNDVQLQAVTTEEKYVRIIAGAGSGKTRVLTYRIAYLIEHFNVDPMSIMAVTFTNKAANEMKSRVVKLVPGASNYLTVSTYHSFCARFLRKEAYLLGFPSSFTILDDEDQAKLVKDIAANKGLKKSDPIVKSAVQYIGRNKTLGRYPNDINFTYEHFKGEKICLDIYEEYEQKKADMFALDFDDLLLYTLKILRDFPDIRDSWSYRFEHILIDEFQDTNDVQFELIKLLINENTYVYVVGDPDQTIYTWRGANQKIILDFPRLFDGAVDIILSQNYRSSKNILDAANALIDKNKLRVKKDLFTLGDRGSQIQAYRFDDDKSEAKWVAKTILSMKDKGIEYKDIAILYRASYVTRSFETELTKNSIPYKIFGGLRFYQRREVKDALAYFKLLLNPKDDISFDRIINVPRRHIGEIALNRLSERAASLGISKYSLCLDSNELSSLSIPQAAKNSISMLISKMEEVKVKLSENEEAYSAVLRDFLSDLGYFAYLVEEENVDEDRVENVNALFDDINSFINENPNSNFDEYLQNISLLTSQDDINAGDYVALMTIHIAKGLEFDNVFVICMNEGSFPSMRTVLEAGDKGLEEERRLAYVAFTRAKKNLFLSTNTAYSYQTDSHSSPSRFLKEAGVEIKVHESCFTRKDNTLNWRSRYENKEPERRPFSFNSRPIEDRHEEVKPKTNGIKDWKLGDKVMHTKFGIGIVSKIISEEIIVIDFEKEGRKTMVGTHPSLSRICSNGGEA